MLRDTDIQLIGITGSDTMVAATARDSYQKKITRFFDRENPKLDNVSLIAFLARHKHFAPSTHPSLQFRFAMPYAIAREWFRHSVGLTRSEASRRYITRTPEFFKEGKFRGKAAGGNKQGSGGELNADLQILLEGIADDANEYCLTAYNKMLEMGACPEQARFRLPESNYTYFTETGSLAAYLRIVSLRFAPDAQKEIRDYAAVVAYVIENTFPVTWAFYSQLNNIKYLLDEGWNNWKREVASHYNDPSYNPNYYHRTEIDCDALIERGFERLFAGQLVMPPTMGNITAEQLQIALDGLEPPILYEDE